MPDTTDTTPHKKTIMVPKVVNGIDTMVAIEVDDTVGPTWGNRSRMTLLDHSLPRIDGPEKVTGRAKYTHDMRVPGMLYGYILHSPYAHARVNDIDTSAADSLPGVQVAIAYRNHELRYEGDPVAAVAAVTPEIAEDAVRAIKVSYAPLPHAVTYEEAIAAGAPAVRGDGNVAPGETRGDPDAVAAQFSTCAAVVTGDFSTPTVHHCCLETHGVMVDYRGGDSATVYASTQGTFSIPGDAAGPLGLTSGQVTAIVQHMGGGFGSKFGIDLPGRIACELSKKCGKPVQLMLTRQQEFLAAGNRSGSVQKLKLGGAADGTLIAMTAEQHRLGGLGDGNQRGQPYIYHVQHSYRSIDSVYTNIDAGRAMRGPGSPEASFAMESILDDLAAKLNIDGVEIRKKNVSNPAHLRQLDLGAQKIGWTSGRNASPGAGQTGVVKRGMGVALAEWGGGGHPECQVEVKIGADGGVDVSVGTQDLGTGTRTYTGAIVAEELGLPLDAVRVHIGDSRLGQASSSGGSTTTASLAPAVKDAAYKAAQAFYTRIAPVLASDPGDLSAAEGKIFGKGGKSIAWTAACAALGAQPVVAHGEWQPSLSDNGVGGAQFAEVEVDTETGKVRVLRLVAVQNCGLPLNRMAIESQLNGGMIQSLGYCLFEGKVTDPDLGLMMNTNFEEYKAPGTREIPIMEPIIDDADTRGVIGMSEACIIPAASAIANAIFNACGVRVRDLPITPDKILLGLGKVQGAAA